MARGSLAPLTAWSATTAGPAARACRPSTTRIENSWSPTTPMRISCSSRHWRPGSATDEMHLDELVAQHQQLDGVLQEVEKASPPRRPDGDFPANRARLAGAVSTMVEHLTDPSRPGGEDGAPLLMSDMPAAEYATARDQGEEGDPAGAILVHDPVARRACFAGSAEGVVPIRRLRCGSSTWLNRRRYRSLDEALLPAG